MVLEFLTWELGDKWTQSSRGSLRISSVLSRSCSLAIEHISIVHVLVELTTFYISVSGITYALVPATDDIVAAVVISFTCLIRASLRDSQIATCSTSCSRHITRHVLKFVWSRFGPSAEPSSAIHFSFLIGPAKMSSDPMTPYPRMDTLICQAGTKQP